MEQHFEALEPIDSRRFEIAIRKLADSLSFGVDRSPFRGTGIEYVQSRGYQPGDPVRAIDWRVTARTGKPFVKEFETPKRMPCWLLIDTSASMTISSVRRSKYEVAVSVAGGLALACLDRVNPVGVMGVGGRDLRVVPSLSKTRIMQWLHRLRTCRFDEPTTLASRLASWVPTLSERSLLIVLSDLHDAGAMGGLRTAAQRHEVAVLQPLDPAELQSKGAGLMRGAEAESGRHFTSFGSSTWTEPYEKARLLKRSGIDHLMLPIDGPIALPVRRFFKDRGLLGRGVR